MDHVPGAALSSLINPEAGKIGATVALSLILVVSLVGISLIVLIVCKTPTSRYVDCKHGLVQHALSNFQVPC